MVETHDHFNQRLRHIGQRHAQMTLGYTTRIRNDGLIVAVPKRRKQAFPAKMILGLVFGFFAFKALLLVSLGPVTYNARLATLAHGTFVERIGAGALQIDPLTDAMASFAIEVLR